MKELRKSYFLKSENFEQKNNDFYALNIFNNKN